MRWQRLNPFTEGRQRLADLEAALAEVEKAVFDLRTEVHQLRDERKIRGSH